MTLDQFISQKAKEETPGSKGWKDRRLPRWKKEYEVYFNLELQRKKDSPEGMAEAARREARIRALERESSIDLEIGESLSFLGSFGRIEEGQILTKCWLGSSFYSHSALRYADCVYVPEEMECIVTRYTAGDEYNFSWIKIERIS